MNIGKNIHRADSEYLIPGKLAMVITPSTGLHSYTDKYQLSFAVILIKTIHCYEMK